MVNGRLQVGPQSAYDGNTVVPRGDWSGDVCVVGGHAFLTEVAQRGKLFTIANQAGVTSQAGLSATTPVLTLYNPAGSGVNAALVYAGATFNVAFASASAVYLAANTDLTAAAVTGTACTAMRNCLLGGSAPSLTPLLAATLPAAPVAIDLLGVGLTGAITTVPHIQTLGKWYMGSIILKPGSALTIQTGVASGNSGMWCQFMWEEITIVS